VFTGETGAGKSLVVDALAFVFGGRRGREVIATGAERAVVEATLAVAGVQVTVDRTVGLSGRTAARMSGETATIDQIREFGERAVDIHGQSDQLAILRPVVQLDVLDGFARLGHKRTQVAALARELREVRRRARALATDTRERERLVEQLRFEIGEIGAAALRSGEDEQLRLEHARLANAGRLFEDVEAALTALDASTVGEAVQAVSDLAGRDPSAGELADLAVLLDNTVADLARALRRYRDAIEDDPARLAETEERLDRIARLRRKYGETVNDILAYAEEAGTRLEGLIGTGQSLAELAAREAELIRQFTTAAHALSLARREAARTLVCAIAAELERLGMGGAGLAIGFACDDDPDGPLVELPDFEVVDASSSGPAEGDPVARAFSESGVDRVEFLASFNPGQAPRPLATVASGGETSRFLLALTTVLGGSAEPRLIVLDEVDEGVGGRAGALVGEALARLAQRHQVFCVTHLPQVAAFGRRHFVVRKQSDGSRTWSDIRAITGDERIDELASMLGGVTEANRAAARELLEAAGD